MENYKEQHDTLLANMPEGATHDKDACLICNDKFVPEKDSTGRGEMETYTKEQVADLISAAVAEAVAPLNDKLAQFDASAAEEAVAAQIAEARKELEAQLEGVRAELDAKVIELQSATEQHESLVAYLDQIKADAEESERLEGLKAERLDAIKEVANFPEDHLEKNLDRWIAMDEDTFQAQLETFKLLAPAKKEGGDAGSIAATAMDNERKPGASKPSVTQLLNTVVDGVRDNKLNIQTRL